MMFDVLKVFADRVRDQTREFADAQQRVSSRIMVKVMDPFGLMAAITDTACQADANTGTDLAPPVLSQKRRKRGTKTARRLKATVKRPALNFA